jgi:hypothetical protein
MAIVPLLEPSTVRAIWEAYQASRNSWESIGVAIGDLGNECDRAVWMTWRWCSEPENFEGQKLRRFETGNREEERCIDNLIMAGADVYQQQTKVFSHGGHVRGKLDAQVMGLPEFPEELVIVEIKALNKLRHAAVKKHGVQHSEVKHYIQMQKYLQLTGTYRGLYFAVNTDNDDIYTEFVAYDNETLERTDKRTENIINSNYAPPRVSEKPDKYPCIFCRHQSVCFKESFGRVNCRTCLHSTPVASENGQDATWHCAKHDEEIPLDIQKTGCPWHTYIPDLVPGKQIDVDGETLIYELPRGKIWRDENVNAPADAA